MKTRISDDLESWFLLNRALEQSRAEADPYYRTVPEMPTGLAGSIEQEAVASTLPPLRRPTDW